MTKIEACMLIVNSRKPSLKRNLGQVLPRRLFAFFLFRERFFPKHASRGNGQKGLVRSRAVDRKRTVMLYSCTAMGGYGPAGSFQIWDDASTPHLQEDHGGWSFRCVLAGMLC